MDQFMKMRKKMSMAESTRQVLNKSIDLLHKLSNKKIAKDSAKKELGSLLSHYFTSSFDGANGISKESKVKLELFLDQAYEILDKTDSGDTPLYEAIMMMNKVVVNNQVAEKVVNEQDTSAPVLRVKEPQERAQTEDEGDEKDEEEIEIEEEIEEEELESEEEEDSQEQHRGKMRINQEEPHNSIKKETGSPSTRRVQFERPTFKNRSYQKQKEVSTLVDEVLQQKFALENSIDQLNHSLRAIGFELRAIQPE